MRLKITILITKIILLAVAVLWFFQNPGTVVIEWQGFEAEVSLGIVLLGLLILFFLYGLIGWLVGRMNHFLSWFYEGKEIRRRRDGRALLSEAFTAQALGCDNKAIELAENAQKLLPLSGIPALILYQVGQELNNASLINKSLKVLNKYKELKPIATAYYLAKYCENENFKEAEKIIESLKKECPKSPWAWREIALYKYKVQDWQAAHESLHKAESLGAFQQDEFNRMASHIWYELSQQPSKDRLNLLKLLEKSFEADETNVTAAVAYAKALKQEGDLIAATTVLKNAWAAKPDWPLAEMYAKILSKGTSDIERLKYIKEISETNSHHPTTILILAIGCLKAKVWGESSKYIQKLPDGVDKRILQAALVKSEKNDIDAATLLIKEVLGSLGYAQSASVI